MHGVALISFFVGMLELHVGRWARSPQNGDPVCQDIALGERPVTVLLLELVGVEIFSRGLATANQEQVVRPQGSRVGHRNDTVDHHGPRYAPLGDGRPKRNSFAVHIEENVRETGSNQKQGENRTRAHKGKEVAIVASAYAVVQPNTVVIQCLDTVVTDTTVVATRRAPDGTGFAVLDRYVHGSNVGRGQFDHDPVVRGRANGQRIIGGIHRRHRVDISRHNTRIDHRGVHKRGEANIKDIAEQDGNGWGDVLP